MSPSSVRERVREEVPVSSRPSLPKSKQTSSLSRPMRLETVTKRPSAPAHQVTGKPVRPASVTRPILNNSVRQENSTPRRESNGKVRRVEQRILEQRQNTRVQHELKEMQETEDLDTIDDDVEDLATLYEWRAQEHTHHVKNPRWFIGLAAGTTAVSTILLLMSNIMGALTIALIGGFMYFVAQRKPGVARYRIMVDGVAINNLLYHYRDLVAFNVVYMPGETKTVILRNNHLFSPLIHMEIGDADPVAIRDMLLEFVAEDQDMQEPVIDILARRLKF